MELHVAVLGKLDSQSLQFGRRRDESDVGSNLKKTFVIKACFHPYFTFTNKRVCRVLESRMGILEFRNEVSLENCNLCSEIS